jgi:hypothetical protein
MILDMYSLMSDDQDLSQVAGTYYSDVLNTLGDAGYSTSNDAPNGVGKDIGKGQLVDLLVQVSETFTSGGAATLDVTLETATDEAFSSPVTLLTGGQFALADLVAGAYLLPQTMPYGGLQWLRVKYVIGTATTTAGTVTAGIITGHQSNR